MDSLSKPSILFAKPLVQSNKTAVQFGQSVSVATEYEESLDTFSKTQRDPHRLIIRHLTSTGDTQEIYRDGLDWAEDLESRMSDVIDELSRGGLKTFDRFEGAVIGAYGKIRGEQTGKPRIDYESYDSFHAEGYGENFGQQASKLRSKGSGKVYQFNYEYQGKSIPVAKFEAEYKESIDRIWHRIFPAHPDQHNEIKQALGDLYESILDLKPKIDAEMEKDSPELDDLWHQAIEEVAEFHWLFTQTMPYQRGSAGIADTMTKILFDHLGIATCRWKEGFRPDLQAFTTSLEEFKKDYASYFEQAPAFYSKLNYDAVIPSTSRKKEKENSTEKPKRLLARLFG